MAPYSVKNVSPISPIALEAVKRIDALFDGPARPRPELQRRDYPRCEGVKGEIASPASLNSR